MRITIIQCSTLDRPERNTCRNSAKSSVNYNTFISLVIFNSSCGWSQVRLLTSSLTSVIQKGHSIVQYLDIHKGMANCRPERKNSLVMWRSHESRDYLGKLLSDGIDRYYCCIVFINSQGAVSIRKTVLPGMAISMLKIRRPNGRLIFNMEIAIRR